MGWNNDLDEMKIKSSGKERSFSWINRPQQSWLWLTLVCCKFWNLCSPDFKHLTEVRKIKESVTLLPSCPKKMFPMPTHADWVALQTQRFAKPHATERFWETWASWRHAKLRLSTLSNSVCSPMCGTLQSSFLPCVCFWTSSFQSQHLQTHDHLKQNSWKCCSNSWCLSTLMFKTHWMTFKQLISSMWPFQPVASCQNKTIGFTETIFIAGNTMSPSSS